MPRFVLIETPYPKPGHWTWLVRQMQPGELLTGRERNWGEYDTQEEADRILAAVLDAGEQAKL